MTTASEPAVVLVGPMAAGKTSVGRAVAKTLGLPFRDSDKHIAAEHGPIPAIFAAQGEEHFRMLERAAIAELLSLGGVVSLGGGAVVDPATRALLAGHTVVFLTVSEEAVKDRLTGSGRPLLQGEEGPLSRWARIYAERRAWYEEVAEAIFDTSRLPMRRVANDIVEWLKEKEEHDH